MRNSLKKPWRSCAWPGVATKPRGRPLPSQRAWSLVEKPPRERPSASVSPACFLRLPRSGELAPPCCRSCARHLPWLPCQREFRALRRTRLSLSSAGSGGTPSSTCRKHRAAGATAHPSSPSTACPRKTAGCQRPVATTGPAQAVEAGQSPPPMLFQQLTLPEPSASPPTPRQTNGSTRSSTPLHAKSSVESAGHEQVNLSSTSARLRSSITSAWAPLSP